MERTSHLVIYCLRLDRHWPGQSMSMTPSCGLPWISLDLPSSIHLQAVESISDFMCPYGVYLSLCLLLFGIGPACACMRRERTSPLSGSGPSQARAALAWPCQNGRRWAPSPHEARCATVVLGSGELAHQKAEGDRLLGWWHPQSDELQALDGDHPTSRTPLWIQIGVLGLHILSLGSCSR